MFIHCNQRQDHSLQLTYLFHLLGEVNSPVDDPNSQALTSEGTSESSCIELSIDVGPMQSQS